MWRSFGCEPTFARLVNEREAALSQRALELANVGRDATRYEREELRIRDLDAVGAHLLQLAVRGRLALLGLLPQRGAQLLGAQVELGLGRAVEAHLVVDALVERVEERGERLVLGRERRALPRAPPPPRRRRWRPAA